MMNLADFVVESNKIEGIVREAHHPLTVHEIEVHKGIMDLDVVKVADLEWFVREVQRGARLRRKVGLDVRVGNYIAPPGGPRIQSQLQYILDRMSGWGPFKTHVKYQMLHPFTDGNGRSGRMLWLWQMGGNAPLGFLHRFYYQTLEAGG